MLATSETAAPAELRPDGLFSSQVHLYKQSGIPQREVCQCKDPSCPHVHYLNEDGTAGPWEIPTPTALETSFRHGGWSANRARVHAALREAKVSEKRIQRFSSCGASCSVEYHPASQRYRTRGYFCGDRFCVPCSRARAGRSRSAILSLCDGLRMRLVTFTRKSKQESLTDAIDHLLESFKKVRRARAWKDFVDGGVAVLEIKRGRGSAEWHVHLHCLTHGRLIPWKPLSDAWYLATGDSFVVDIREVKEKERGVGYVCKYLGKGFDASVFHDADDLRECITALGGRRMLIPFGDWYGRVGDVEIEREDGWKLVGSLHGIVSAADGGEEWARGILMNLRSPAGSAPTLPRPIPPPGEN